MKCQTLKYNSLLCGFPQVISFEIKYHNRDYIYDLFFISTIIKNG